MKPPIKPAKRIQAAAFGENPLFIRYFFEEGSMLYREENS
jgi:hypothetical protein